MIRGLSTGISALGPIKAVGRELLAGALLGLLMVLVVPCLVEDSAWSGVSRLRSAGDHHLAATAGAGFPLLFDRRAGPNIDVNAVHHHLHRRRRNVDLPTIADWLLTICRSSSRRGVFLPISFLLLLSEVRLRFLGLALHN